MGNFGETRAVQLDHGSWILEKCNVIPHVCPKRDEEGDFLTTYILQEREQWNWALNSYYLTNRFHFAVRLYADNAQMTSKRGENKEVWYEPQASSVTDVLTTF